MLNVDEKTRHGSRYRVNITCIYNEWIVPAVNCNVEFVKDFLTVNLFSIKDTTLSHASPIFGFISLVQGLLFRLFINLVVTIAHQC